MEMSFIEPTALAGHFNMTAHVITAIKIDADVSELEGLAITGKAEREFRKQGCIESNDFRYSTGIIKLKGKRGPIKKGTVFWW